MNTPSSSSTKQRVGIFTGGGIAPGLNAVLSTAARVLKAEGHEAVGLPEGWKGLLSVREDALDLSGMTRRELHDLLSAGGTVLRSSRTKIKPTQYEQVAETVRGYGLTGLIAIGGDDTLGQARELQEAGIIRAIGVPKTIDNDVEGTDKTFGFESAVHRAAEQIRDMRTDATSMSRVAVVEVMGRNAGWITLHAGEAGGADITLIPEVQIDERYLMERIRQVYGETGANGRPANCAVIAISEGYFGEDPTAEKDAFGHGKLAGAADKLAAMIKQATGLGTQTQVVNYYARNGAPVAHDAIFASRLGAYAGMLAAAGQYGNLVAYRDGQITHAPLSEVSGGRHVPLEMYDPETLSMCLVPKNVAGRIREMRDKIDEAVKI
jgi:6-phosphofructokinase 1